MKSIKTIPTWARLGSGQRNLMAISPKKLAVLKMPAEKRSHKEERIAKQVILRQQQIQISRSYQCFTTAKPSRRPRQVGAHSTLD